MALKIAATISFNVGNAVASRIDAFTRARTSLQQQAELGFYQQVQQGMTYAQQLTFRKAQLEQEQGREVPDQVYVSALKKEVATTTKLVAQERFKTAYFQSYSNLVSGHGSYQDHIDFLQSQLDATSDPDQKDKIQQYLTQALGDQYTVENQIVDNYFTYAQKDKTLPILQQALDRVGTEKAKALARNDRPRLSALVLQEQALKQSVAQTQIQNTLHQFDISKLKTYNPIDMVDQFNEQINSADSQTPITYNGETYNSVKEFWQAQKADFFNSGKFDKALSTYVGDVAQIATNQSSASVPTQLAVLRSTLDSFAHRADVADFAQLIAGSVATSMSKAVDDAAVSILNEAVTTYDFQGAASALSRLAKSTGVDQTQNYYKLISQASSVNSEAANNILSNANAYQQSGMNSQDALSAAIQDYNSGKTTVTYSPEQAASKSPTQIAQETATGAPGGKQPASATVTPPANLASLKEGDVFKLPGSPTVYTVKAGSYQAISGKNVSDQQFQQLTGKTFADVKTVNSLESLGLSKGADIAVPSLKPITQVIGTRPSASAPATKEYYRLDTSQGIGKEADLFSYLGGLGYSYKNFDSLNADLNAK